MICQLFRMRKAAILALAALLVMPALAAEHEAKEGGEGAKKGEGGKKGGKPGTNVDMPFLMAPLTNTDGKLMGYAYISSRLTASSEANALVVREKLPFVQDAFVRDVNRSGITTPEDPEKVDIASVEARLLADAKKAIGADKVKLLTVCTVQVSPLHPVQTPALSPPPEVHGAPPPKNPEKSRCES